MGRPRVMFDIIVDMHEGKRVREFEYYLATTFLDNCDLSIEEIYNIIITYPLETREDEMLIGSKICDANLNKKSLISQNEGSLK